MSEPSNCVRPGRRKRLLHILTRIFQSVGTHNIITRRTVNARRRAVTSVQIHIQIRGTYLHSEVPAPGQRYNGA